MLWKYMFLMCTLPCMTLYFFEFIYAVQNFTVYIRFRSITILRSSFAPVRWWQSSSVCLRVVRFCLVKLLFLLIPLQAVCTHVIVYACSSTNYQKRLSSSWTMVLIHCCGFLRCMEKFLTQFDLTKYWTAFPNQYEYILKHTAEFRTCRQKEKAEDVDCRSDLYTVEHHSETDDVLVQIATRSGGNRIREHDKKCAAHQLFTNKMNGFKLFVGEAGSFFSGHCFYFLQLKVAWVLFKSVLKTVRKRCPRVTVFNKNDVLVFFP